MDQRTARTDGFGYLCRELLQLDETDPGIVRDLYRLDAAFEHGRRFFDGSARHRLMTG